MALVSWTEMDRSRWLARFAEYWPTSQLVRNQENKQLRLAWFSALARFPVACALEALGKIYEEAEFQRMPTLLAVKQKTAELYHAEEKQLRQKELLSRKPTDLLTPQEFAADDEWWTPRVNHADPKVAAYYKRVRKYLAGGGAPIGVLSPEILREPGEDA